MKEKSNSSNQSYPLLHGWETPKRQQAHIACHLTGEEQKDWGPDGEACEGRKREHKSEEKRKARGAWLLFVRSA